MVRWRGDCRRFFTREREMTIFKKIINGDTKSMKELKGKLILVEYFAHW